MNKKKILLGLSSGVPLSLLSAVTVVSCDLFPQPQQQQQEVDLNKYEELKGLKLVLNNKGKQLTTSQFYDEAIQNPVGTLEKYTNWSSVISIAREKNIFITFEALNLKNHVIEVKIKIDSNNDTLLLSGFKANSEFVDEVFNSFKLVVSEQSKLKTSEEIYDAWVNGNPSYRNFQLISNFVLDNYTITQGNDGNLVYVDNKNNRKINIIIDSVEWNSRNVDNNVKGTELSINLTFSYTNSSGKEYVKSGTKFASGFLSYQQKFDKLLNEFKSQKISARPNADLNAVVSAVALLEKIQNQNTEEGKFRILEANTTIGSFPVFDKNSNLPYSASIDTYSLGSNDTVIDISCTFKWKEMTQSNVVLSIKQFRSSDEYLNDLYKKLAEVNLVPTDAGRKLSSIEVAQKFQENPASLGQYIDLTPLNEIPGISVIIKSVEPNNQDNVPTRERGSTITSISATFDYNSASHPVTFSNITGFTTLYSIAVKELDRRVRNIRLELSPKAGTAMPSQVNEYNWKTYVTNIPEETNGYFISNLNFYGSDDRSGLLVVTFDYNYTFFDEVITKTISSQRLYKMLSNVELATKNFNVLRDSMQHGDYMDSIIKSSERKSSYFTSYFANSIDQLAALKELFDIPWLFGTNVSLADNLRYSKSDNRLSDTQLRINLKLTNEFDQNMVFTKEYVVGGFKDPYGYGQIYGGRNIRDMINTAPYPQKLNSPDYKTWDEVPGNMLAPNPGSWQTHWGIAGVAYGYTNPYKYYVEGSGLWVDGDLGNGKKVKQMAEDIIRSQFANTGIDVVVGNWSLDNNTYGAHKTGTKDSHGICRGDIKCAIRFTSRARDDKGHLADYNSHYVEGVHVFIYFKNGFWGQ